MLYALFCEGQVGGSGHSLPVLQYLSPARRISKMAAMAPTNGHTCISVALGREPECLA
jgi:hypothetical protein